jgi:hypothetical protein
VGEPEVPLNDDYPKAIAFVVGDRMVDGVLRSAVRGTAFIVSVAAETIPGARFPYVVTSAHVVRPLIQSAVRLNLKVGGVRDLPVPEWVFHPTEDVAIAPMQVSSEYDVRSIPDSAFADTWATPLPLGGVVYFLGLLQNMTEMHSRNIPMVRSGSLGARYQANVPVEIAPATTITMTAHLIDCRSYGGFSGSPCFVQFEGKRMRADEPNRKVVEIGTATLLLGVVAGHFDLYTLANLKGGGPEFSVPINSGVGVVVPVETIREVLMSEDLVFDRRQREEAIKREPGPRGAAADALEREPEEGQ